jgi:hypothetical protein
LRPTHAAKKTFDEWATCQNVEAMLDLTPSLEARGIRMSGIESIVATGATTLAVDLLRDWQGQRQTKSGSCLAIRPGSIAPII